MLMWRSRTRAIAMMLAGVAAVVILAALPLAQGASMCGGWCHVPSVRQASIEVESSTAHDLRRHLVLAPQADRAHGPSPVGPCDGAGGVPACCQTLCCSTLPPAAGPLLPDPRIDRVGIVAPAALDDWTPPGQRRPPRAAPRPLPAA
jgi:hypothetical protein